MKDKVEHVNHNESVAFADLSQNRLTSTFNRANYNKTITSGFNLDSMTSTPKRAMVFSKVSKKNPTHM